MLDIDVIKAIRKWEEVADQLVKTLKEIEIHYGEKNRDRGA